MKYSWNMTCKYYSRKLMNTDVERDGESRFAVPFLIWFGKNKWINNISWYPETADWFKKHTQHQFVSFKLYGFLSFYENKILKLMTAQKDFQMSNWNYYQTLMTEIELSKMSNRELDLFLYFVVWHAYLLSFIFVKDFFCTFTHSTKYSLLLPQYSAVKSWI